CCIRPTSASSESARCCSSFLSLERRDHTVVIDQASELQAELLALQPRRPGESFDVSNEQPHWIIDQSVEDQYISFGKPAKFNRRHFGRPQQGAKFHLRRGELIGPDFEVWLLVQAGAAFDEAMAAEPGK